MACVFIETETVAVGSLLPAGHGLGDVGRPVERDVALQRRDGNASQRRDGHVGHRVGIRSLTAAVRTCTTRVSISTPTAVSWAMPYGKKTARLEIDLGNRHESGYLQDNLCRTILGSLGVVSGLVLGLPTSW